MTVSLAYTMDGDSFTPPEGAVAWRVKRLRPGKGAPELVYGPSGTPLIVPLECTAEELRCAVVSPGRYRLDPVDDQDRLLRQSEAAYVWVHPLDQSVAAPIRAATLDTNAVVIEALRQNTELARTIIERFPAMLDSSAALLRAADGAGLSRRLAVEEHVDDDRGRDDTDDDRGRVAGFDLHALLAQVVPALLLSLGNGKVKLPSIPEMLDWRRAVPKADEPARAPKEISSPPSATDPPPTLSPQAMVHFAAVQSALSPHEAELARAAASELPPRELYAWVDALTAMSVPDAVDHIRGHLVRLAKQEPSK